jgi:hypothetical protein
VNKLLLFFWLLIFVPSWSQDTATVSKKVTQHYTEKDIKIEQDGAVTLPQFKTNLKSKYSDTDYRYEVKLNEKSLWDRFTEWLAYWFKKIFGLNNFEKSKDYANITLKLLSCLIVIFVIYLIVKVILNKEGQWVFGKSTTKKIIYDDDIEKNLIHVDFDKLIKETLKAGDHRLVVRYYYLWVLKTLSEQNLIDWHAEKTNTDYLYELTSAELKAEFQYLSYLYNYIWYGEFDMTDATFLHAKKAFENTIQTLQK